jgi:hypothetical protein
LNYYTDDLVIALHFNYGGGSVDSEAAAQALAALYMPHKPTASGGGSPPRP